MVLILINLLVGLYSNSIIVAIIDTGFDIDHKQLKSKLWVNPGEQGIDKFGKDKSTNSIDDDNNGFINDIHGWNFVDNNNILKDKQEHGTHIAGIIAKYSAPSVELMLLKYYDKEKKIDTIKSFVAAVNYAIDNKANIINFSGGGRGYSQEEFNAIKKAKEKNILIVTAAGNYTAGSVFSASTDKESYYPASYNLDNLLTVASANSKGKIDSFSNYGKKTVDISAEGNNIYSSFPNNSFAYLKGTSQSTALVTAYLTHIIKKHNNYSYKFIKEKTISSLSSVKGLDKFLKSDKFLSLAKLESISKIDFASVNKTKTLN